MTLSLLVLLVLLYCANEVKGAPDNRGKEFIIGFMENYQTSFNLEIFVTTSRTTKVYVEVTAPKYPAAKLNERFTVTAGQVKQVTFTNKLRLIQTELSSKGVYIKADDEVVVYGVNKETYSNDAFLGLPVDVLGQKYYAIAYYPPTRNTEVLVVGVHDKTSVTLTLPNHNKVAVSWNRKTYKANSKITVTLNRFDTFQIATKGDLTGTSIVANKPVSAFSGNRKTNIGKGGSQDHLVEHLTPTDVWGKDFVTIPTPDRTTGDYYRIIASEDNTRIKVNGQIRGKTFKDDITLSKAGYWVQKHYDSKLYANIVSDKPILLAQYVLSQQSSREEADPAMLIIPPIEQYGADYTFATPKYSRGSYINYFMFVVKEKEKTGLMMDGKAISGVTYNKIPGTDYVGGYIKISEGSHTVRHKSPISVFGGYLFGRANYESYGFTTGMRLAPINVPCVKTKTAVGDGIDNDCDGLIDEELCTVENKGKDDDGDGVAEEDCAKPPPIDGMWASWGSWATCSVSCTSGKYSTGSRSRRRSCTNPVPKYDGKQCSGSATELGSCKVYNGCPVDGKYSSWSRWGSCSVTCGSGKQTRTRTCTPPLNGGLNCVGANSEQKTCTKSNCPIDGGYSSWSTWTRCDKSCGGGKRKRERSCTNPSPAYGGKKCSGAAVEEGNCNTHNCPVDGKFSKWSSWGKCSVTCATGIQTRTRTCSPPKYGGKDCIGDRSERRSCTQKVCPIDGGYTSWSTWSKCDKTCGGGKQMRERSCSNPKPAHGGKSCSGAAVEEGRCNTHNCPVHGKFSMWSSWGACSVTCANGTQRRTRTCSTPLYGGNDCVGARSEAQSCRGVPCPVDGKFSAWSRWDKCSVTCGGGLQISRRTCTNPAPQYGGASCVGDTSKKQKCNTLNCPIDGKFTTWSSWGRCSVSCGGGTQSSSRSCTNPAPQYNGAPCTGATSKSQDCNTHFCPIDGAYSAWGVWGKCSVSCGGGTQDRSRRCDSPAPQYGGSKCSGASSDTQDCNTHNCPIDGGFTHWTKWNTCSVTCGGGSQRRKRSCTNPRPQYGGANCVGDLEDEQACNIHNCPIDGGYSTWTRWGTCTVSCGGGTQEKTRQCNSPAPQYGGAQCVGPNSATQNCNTHNCPIDGGFTVWTQWNICTVTCGGGSQRRGRTCTNPSPQYGGANCVGDSNEVQSCNTHNCPIDGGYSSWTNWGTCTVSCGGGTQVKTRRCDSPTPQYGGAQCVGASSETQNCNTHNCPIHGDFTTWTSWDTCTLTCGGGTQGRSRTCTNPIPQYGGNDCVGDRSQNQPCNTHNCPIDGGFTDWTSWDTCSVSCGGGSQGRTRSCTNPAPQYGGASCVGDTSQTQDCNTQVCIIDGAWSAWSAFGMCSVSCGGGKYSRTRTCSDPYPKNGGLDCQGSSSEFVDCNVQACPTAAPGAYVQLCPTGWFTCQSGAVSCVDRAFVCDCESDCDDGSDETTSYAQCDAQVLAQCPSGAMEAVPLSFFSIIVGVVAALIMTIW